MTNIRQIMVDTAAKYQAKNAVQFSQAEYFDKGVCHAMCLRWIKSRHKVGFFSGPTKGIARDSADKERTEIATIQSNLKGYKGDIIPTKSHGGFAHLDAVRINELTIEAPGWHTVEAGAKAMTYEKLLETAATFCSGLTSGGASSVIGLNDGGPGHAVATARWKGRFYFMDPNGGVLIFQSADFFKNWFNTELPKATSDNYHQLRWIEVENYHVGAAA